MENFELYVSTRTIRDNAYGISRSSKVYSFLRNEYHGISDNEYGFLLNQGTERGIISSFIGRVIGTDSSIKIPIGSPAHIYYTTEYNHSLPEDAEHSIIVPEEGYSKIINRS